MQIHRISYRVRGFVKLADYAIRWTRMVTDKAKYKARVLAFWAKHGLEATVEAFKVKERTLYLWKAQQKQGSGSLESLNEKSRRPKTIRAREWPQAVKDEIRRFRTEHPNLGKEKVHIFLKPYCAAQNLVCPSVSTVGNLIRDMGGLRTFPVKVRHDGRIVRPERRKRTRKPKGFRATRPGHCGSFDTVERIINSSRRYLLTFTDVYSRFSFAWATTSHASAAAKEFFSLVAYLFPFPFEYVLTDNGSEFAKHFDAEIRRLHKTHWHTYPKTPKMNAHCERFNRTVQEEYLNFHASELILPERFNQGLMRYLMWYNTERPHWGIGLQTPVQFIREKHPEECKMYLTNTII